MLKTANALQKNYKTLYTVDFTTNCVKRRAGNECVYCYVKHHRDIGFNVKKVIDYLPYDSKMLYRLSDETIEQLNSFGGLRLFSYGDYMPEHDEDIRHVLTDCRAIGLMAKAITKQVQFIDNFYDDFKDVFSVIHISIDNIGCGVPWDVAQAYRAKYKKVLIRSVILRMDDIDIMDKMSDIMTFNHEHLKKKIPDSITIKSSRRFKHEMIKRFEHKMCCITGRCIDCPVKCGINIIK